MQITLFYAGTRETPSNTKYPNKVEVTDRDTLIRAVSNDYVCAEYIENCRSNDNFIRSNCVALDCDNSHSDNPDDWVTPFDVAKAFPNVAFMVHYSRNHMKEKNGKVARPKFHALLSSDSITDSQQYSEIKQRVNTIFPYFDAKALDAARFFFGTQNPEVEIFDGPLTLTAFLAERDSAAKASNEDQHIEKPHKPEGGSLNGQAAVPVNDDLNPGMDSCNYGSIVIPEGTRNNKMSNYAGRILKRFGDTDEAYKLFLEEASHCQPPLEESELNSIWLSAQGFYKRLSAQEDYVPPKTYNREPQLQPTDYSDVGQATVLAREYSDRLCYSSATSFLVYNGSVWEESETKPRSVAQELTNRQLKEADNEIKKATDEMMKNGAWKLLTSMGPKKANTVFSEEQAQSYQYYLNATTYREFAIKRRNSQYITAALKEASGMVEINPKQLDEDGFLLNTPSRTYDLRIGLASAREHRPTDYITKCTEVDPSDEGMEIWQDNLRKVFCDDSNLINYVQEIVGLTAIGEVKWEGLIIAYGEGRNGKSTFWNSISKVLGNYSGNMSADTLTAGCRRNVKPEMAEIKGKRLIIAAELEEGMRLSTSVVKQLCSTDHIVAEKKFQAPFRFTPTHTVVLYTNHLPKVGALDDGTWRRIIVIPFNAIIEGTSDIKNYADYLFEKAGGAILSWIIEGAKHVIDKGYHLDAPKLVDEAIKKYKDNNDWLGHFLLECCDLDPRFRAKSGEVYAAYRNYSDKMGEYTRSNGDFNAALESNGIGWKKSNTGNILLGLRLKSSI